MNSKCNQPNTHLGRPRALPKSAHTSLFIFNSRVLTIRNPSFHHAYQRLDVIARNQPQVLIKSVCLYYLMSLSLTRTQPRHGRPAPISAKQDSIDMRLLSGSEICGTLRGRQARKMHKDKTAVEGHLLLRQ